MNIRSLSIVVALAAALGAASASAQQSPAVARLTNLEGQVLVSQGDAMVAATNTQRVAVGTRVLTTAGATVVINYDVGCSITLKPNERFTVRIGECGALANEVVALGPAPGAIGGGAAAAGGGIAGIGTVGSVVVVGTVAVIGTGIYQYYRDKSVSPN